MHCILRAVLSATQQAAVCKLLALQQTLHKTLASAFVHGSLLHIDLNMLAFVPMLTLGSPSPFQPKSLCACSVQDNSISVCAWGPATCSSQHAGICAHWHFP